MGNCFWSFLTPQGYAFCERQLCHLVQQPANTWSNVGYLIAAILIFRLKLPEFERRFLSSATFFLFLGSTFFHMSGTKIGKYIDVSGMLVLSMGICALSYQRALKWDDCRTARVFFLGLVPSLGFLFFMGFGNVVFATHIVLAVITELKLIKRGESSMARTHFRYSLIAVLAAGVFLLLDVTRVWCDPDNHLVNGHAIWHLLAAVAIYQMAIARVRAPA